MPFYLFFYIIGFNSSSPKVFNLVYLVTIFQGKIYHIVTGIALVDFINFSFFAIGTEPFDFCYFIYS